MQGLLINACARLVGAVPEGASAKVTGASRTDAGVHALRQVASLSLDTGMTPEALRRALNALLPAQVRVTDNELAYSALDSLTIVANAAPQAQLLASTLAAAMQAAAASPPTTGSDGIGSPGTRNPSDST